MASRDGKREILEKFQKRKALKEKLQNEAANAEDAAQEPSKKKRRSLPLATPAMAPAQSIHDSNETMLLEPPKLKNEKRPDKQELKQKLLPSWLANPTVISSSIDDAVPLSEFAQLSPAIVQTLEHQNILTLFPVQATLLPLMLQPSVRVGHPGDICVAAPTGSGKTLAYVIPIIQALQTRVVVRLRALVIVPTRELVTQVLRVFQPFCEATGLKIGSAIGQSGFVNEQKLLVPKANKTQGGCSLVDILVATPGRLIDHLTATPGFTLQHLRYLIVDEADRLLNQSYQDWLKKVLEASEKQIAPPKSFGREHDAVSLRFNPTQSYEAEATSVPLQKLLFSATLTRNPSKIASLKLVSPRYLSVGTSKQSRFTTPSTLQENMVVCEDDQKPLIVIYMMCALKLDSVICFTSSVDATHRLFRLLELYGGISAAEFSSQLTHQERHSILDSFRNGLINILVCSDGMARGMDIERVNTVISYDSPVRIQTYVHRVGRTARAGREGTSYTLMAPREVKHFKQMIKKSQNAANLHRFKLQPEMLEPYVEGYKRALESLRDAMKEEKLNKVSNVSHVTHVTHEEEQEEETEEQEEEDQEEEAEAEEAEEEEEELEQEDEDDDNQYVDYDEFGQYDDDDNDDPDHDISDDDHHHHVSDEEIQEEESMDILVQPTKQVQHKQAKSPQERLRAMLLQRT